MFTRLVLPLSVPALASLAIFQFMFIWNDLLIGLVYGGSENKPIIAKLVEVGGTFGQSWHLLTASAFVSMAVPLIVFFAPAAVLRARPARRSRQGMTGAWWREAVIYQVYVRSFADADGDGLGDLAGIRSRLDHIAGLGVDAIWLNPFYPSPQADAGYDVSDYRDVDPGSARSPTWTPSLADAHARGLRVIVDIVPNHTATSTRGSGRRLAGAGAAPERARYLFRDGQGPTGDQPPNDWLSVFGGPAWTRIVEADGRPGQWYLHLFDTEQPDLDWTNAEVRDEFRRRSCASGSTAASTGSASTSPTAWSRTRTSPTSPAASRPAGAPARPSPLGP